MSANRDGTPLIDIVAVCVSPAFIMLMVGSLVWFLVDVLYQGQYPDRLLWCLSCFIFGAVLIARITIEQGYAQASAYALGLGAATFLAMIRFVEYRNNTVEAIGWAISLGLMGLVWWMANKLTWDCTHFEDDRKASGRGLLTAAGWDVHASAEPDASDTDDENPNEAAKPKKKDPAGLMGWMQRFWRYRDARRKRPHTPGTWVLYIGLAALPVFALGQSLISPEDTTRRRTTLMEAAIFVGGALGLLVTTSLMGLRRYLEQRNAKVPVAMTLGWLGLGGALIVMFLAVAVLLPRPHSETPWLGMSRTKDTTPRNASRNAVLKDGSGGQGDGAKGTKQEPGENSSPSKSGSQPGGTDQKQQPGIAGQKGQPGQKGGSDDGKSGQTGSGEKNGKQPGGKEPGGKDPGGKTQPGGNEPGGKTQPGGQQQAGGEKGKTEPKDGSQDSDEKNEKTEQEAPKRNPFRGEEPESTKSQRKDSESGSSTRERLSEAMSSVGSLMKWLIWALLALAVLAGIVFFVLRGLAPFTDWAKNLLDWFRNLFAGRRTSGSDSANGPDDTPAKPKRPPSFAEFSNPFTDGTAKRRTPAELAAYTFAALDAWAWDRDQGRKPGETPSEFAERLGEAFPNLDASANRVADLLVRAMYSKAKLPADAAKSLAILWKHLEQAVLLVSGSAAE